jgi:hypothetical protein
MGTIGVEYIESFSNARANGYPNTHDLVTPYYIAPKGTTMGAIIAVSAATTVFGSIGLPGRAATGTAPRR